MSVAEVRQLKTSVARCETLVNERMETVQRQWEDIMQRIKTLEHTVLTLTVTTSGLTKSVRQLQSIVEHMHVPSVPSPP